MNCADWFSLYGGYMFWTFSTGESTELFDIPEAMCAYIQGRLKKINVKSEEPEAAEGPEEPGGASKDNAGISPRAQLARWFEPAEDPILKLALPPLHLSNEAWERAVALAQKLMGVARRQPYVVGRVVLRRHHAWPPRQEATSCRTLRTRFRFPATARWPQPAP